MDIFSELGYLGLFLSAFLAATILPLSSEAALGFLLLNEFNPFSLVAIATIGNVLGSFTNYSIGFFGSQIISSKALRLSGDEFNKAKKRFKKYGIMSLFFSWVPIIGDPLTLVAGVMKINLWWFFALVTTGKLLRYIVISHLILKYI